MGKENVLRKLKEEIEACRHCRTAGLGKQVFGEGDTNAKIMFVGEAPGKKEAETGRPFIGRSGQLLRMAIRTAGLKETEIYITSPVKFLPKKGTPSRKEILHSQSHFTKQVEIISPEIIVLLGKTAVYAVLNEDLPILKVHGKLIEKEGGKILITLHPAAVLRFPKYKKLFEGDLLKLKRLITK